MTSFSKLLGSLRSTGDMYEPLVPAELLDAGAVHSNLALALAVQAARKSRPGLPPLRSVQAAFTGESTGSLKIFPVAVACGQYSAFMGVDVSSAGGSTLIATMAYGAARTPTLTPIVLPMPLVLSPQSWKELPPLGTKGSFFELFEWRVTSARDTKSDLGCNAFHAWVRFRDGRARLNESSLIALAGAIPFSAQPVLNKMGVLHVLTCSIDLFVDTFPDTGWHLVRTSIQHLSEGICNLEITVWSENGYPVLVARQVVSTNR